MVILRKFIILALNFVLLAFAAKKDDKKKQDPGRAFFGVFSSLSKHRKYQEPLLFGDHSKMQHYINFERVTPDSPGGYLYATLLRNYNQHVLPVNSSKDTVVIGLLLKLTQIVEVDEKNQIMTTNVWLRHQWYDSNLRWDPKQFGGIKSLHIPADDIWLPDTVLYNNADGDYQITIQTKVEVNYNGFVSFKISPEEMYQLPDWYQLGTDKVVWEPPAIYKSFCAIDVEFFPYDRQSCEMKFGPWTYDVSKVDFVLLNPDGTVSKEDETLADTAGFYESVEWDVMRINGIRKVFQYPCCEEKYVDVTYVFDIRRRTLFYTINLIIPCVMIALITVLVFYLPNKSGEKVAFSISTLLALTWFILLLSEIIPPTSLALPLIGKYLLFTMVLVTMSILVSIIVLYNHFRHPYGFSMPPWVRYLFLDVLPMILWFHTTIFATEKPEDDDAEEVEQVPKLVQASSSYYYAGSESSCSSISNNCDDSLSMSSCSSPKEYENLPSPPPGFTSPRHSSKGKSSKKNSNKSAKTSAKTLRNRSKLSMTDAGHHRHHKNHRIFSRLTPLVFNDMLAIIGRYMVLPEVEDAARCIQYISKRYYDGDIEARMKDDWEAVSRVSDRLFLIVFSTASLLGTIAILLRSPNIYDNQPALTAASSNEIVL